MKMFDKLPCTRCKQTKNLNNFTKVKLTTNLRGYDAWCKQCHAETSKLWRQNNKDTLRMIIIAKQKRRSVIRSYGITPTYYNKLVILQDGRCAICKCIPNRDLDIDHCHESGEIRGLLCSNCNKTLGMFKNDPELLQNAIDYLIAFQIKMIPVTADEL